MSVTARTIIDMTRRQGFPAARVVSLSAVFSGLCAPGIPLPGGKETLRTLRREFPGDGTFLICAFPCYIEKSLLPVQAAGSTTGILAGFAAGNYYLEAVLRLKKLRRELGSLLGLKPAVLRIFCNSRLPEKILAFASGLGFYARNSLLISRELGSMFVISGLFLPRRLPDAASMIKAETPRCLDCRRCARACPAGAISGYAVIDTSRCLQALSTMPCILPDATKAVWGRRIYGCQTCQDVCPYNKCLPVGEATSVGWFGTRLELKEILTRDYADLKRFFRQSVLDRSWIDLRAIKRNAIVACGHCRNPELLPLVNRYRRDEHEFIRDAACWAASRLFAG